MDEPSHSLETASRVVYPPPPGVHWGALVAAQLVIAVLTVMFTPKAYWNLVMDLVFDAWALYLCLWLHRLDARFMSIFWCVAFVALQLAIATPFGLQPFTAGITIVTGIVALACLCTWVVTIYVIRAELHLHYNVREPIGLYLSGVMTLFFSFLYFQYHLYKIAQLRERHGDRLFYYQGGGPPLDIPDS
jgi:hypothetical protein